MAELQFCNHRNLHMEGYPNVPKIPLNSILRKKETTEISYEKLKMQCSLRKCKRLPSTFPVAKPYVLQKKNVESWYEKHKALPSRTSITKECFLQDSGTIMRSYNKGLHMKKYRPLLI